MSEAQRTMLFSLFARLAKTRGWGPAQRALERTRITIEALGDPASWSACGNAQVDLLKARLLAELAPGSLEAQLAEVTASADGERRRLVHRIEADARRAGFGDGYMQALVRDLKDSATPWHELALHDLGNLRDTIAQRARRKRFAARSKAVRESGTPAVADCPF